ncbi:cytochrome P450 [Streptomyces sp. NPDC047028]|uniref:cytochrome P450 family protein n=1 Tax=Streptomyces sp. NPDC047028 TaxID=3155793 RepID=UPI0033DCCE54
MTDSIKIPPTRPMTPKYFQDPFPTYQWLRDNAPVYPAPVPYGPKHIWMVTRYNDVKAVLVDPRFSSDPKYAGPALKMFTEMLDAFSGAASMNSTDGADHERIRSVAARAFTTRSAARWREVIASAVEQLLDSHASGERIDLMMSYAYPLPIMVICEVLGIPTADQGQLGRWVHAMSSTEPAERANVPVYVRELREYTRATIAAKRAAPDDRLLTSIITACDEEGQLTHEELVVMVAGFFVAGYDTTANLIANGVLALLDHPDQLGLLIEHPDLASAAVDEILRYTDTATSQWRWTTEAVEVAGVTIPAGETVFPVLGAAHRDPTAFPSPNEFRITRRPNAHIGFGYGVHRCLGAALAKLETEVAVPALFRRFPALRLDCERSEIWYKPAMIIRSPAAVPVIPLH